MQSQFPITRFIRVTTLSSGCLTALNLAGSLCPLALGLLAAFWTGCSTVQSGSGSALHAAIEQGKLDQASELIPKQKTLDARDAAGNTALHLTAARGLTNLTEQLLKAGSPVNSTTPSGETPLYAAAAAGHSGIARLLIDHGALVNVWGKDRITPLGIAAANGHLEMVQLLATNGALINAQTSDGSTALILATWRGYEQVVEFLLASGADPNLVTTEGFTALMETASWTSNRMANALIERGADVNARTESGVTPLMLAARHGNLPLAQLLIQHGAQLNVTNRNGETALYIASYNGKSNVLPALCDADSDLNHRANNGRTPFHAAALRRDADELEYLVRRGAQPFPLAAGLENSHATALVFQYHTWLLIEQSNTLAAREACAKALGLFEEAASGYEQVAAQIGKQVRHERWMAVVAITAGALAEGLSTVGAQHQHHQYAQMSALHSASVSGTGHAGYFQTMSTYKAPTAVPINGVGVGITAAGQRLARAAEMGSGRKIMQDRAIECRNAATACRTTLACLENKTGGDEVLRCLDSSPRSNQEARFRERRPLSELLAAAPPNKPN